MVFPFHGARHPASPEFLGFAPQPAAQGNEPAQGATPTLYQHLFGYQPERTTLADYISHSTQGPVGIFDTVPGVAQHAFEQTPESMQAVSDVASPSPLWIQGVAKSCGPGHFSQVVWLYLL